MVRDAVDLARLEGLEGHARAAEKRLVGGKRAGEGENGHADKKAKTNGSA